MNSNDVLSRAPSNPSSDSRPIPIVADPSVTAPGAGNDIAIGPQGLRLDTSGTTGNGGLLGLMNPPRTPDMMRLPGLPLITTSPLGASRLMLGAPGSSCNPSHSSQQQAFLNSQNSGIPVAPAPNIPQSQHPVAKKATTQMNKGERKMVAEFVSSLADHAAFISTLNPSLKQFFSELTTVIPILGHVKVKKLVEEYGEFILTSLKNETECRQLNSLLDPLESLKAARLLPNGKKMKDLAKADKVPYWEFADKLRFMSVKMESTFDYLLSSIAGLLKDLGSVKVWEMVIVYGDLCIQIAKQIQSGASASSGSAPIQNHTAAAQHKPLVQVHFDANEPAIGAPQRDANIKKEVENGPSRDAFLAKIAELEAVVKARNEEMAKNGAPASSGSITGASRGRAAPSDDQTAAAQQKPPAQVHLDAHEPAMEVSPPGDNIGEDFYDDFDLPVESGPSHESFEAKNTKLKDVETQKEEIERKKKDREEELSRIYGAHRQEIEKMQQEKQALMEKHAYELKRLKERTSRNMSEMAVFLGLQSERIKAILDKEVEQWFEKNWSAHQDQASSASDFPDARPSTPSTSSPPTRKRPIGESIEKGTDEVKKPRSL